MTVLNDAAILALTAPPPEPASFTLVLVPIRDPIERNGHPPRTPEYRLKILLKAIGRGYGFRVTECRPAAAPGAPTAVAGQIPPAAGDRVPGAA